MVVLRQVHPAGVLRHLRRAAGLALVMLLAFCAAPAGAQSPSFDEYQVKAVFLYNFTRFVEWPEGAFTSDQSPIVIGVLGADPFGRFLPEVIQGEEVAGRSIQIRNFNSVEEIGECHILYIGRSERGRLDDVLAAIGDRHILTVGDLPDFARLGGVIGCVTENRRIRLKINLEAARRAGLTLSSKLLRPAEIVASMSEE